MYPLFHTDAQPAIFLLCPSLVFLPTLPTLFPFQESPLFAQPTPSAKIEDRVNNFQHPQLVIRKTSENQQNQLEIASLPQKNSSASKPHSDRGDNIQLKNRNILPNTVNVILSYVRRSNRSRRAAQSAIRAMGLGHVQQTLRKFYAYQSFLKNNATDFITRQAIQALMDHQNPHCSFFSLQEQQLYNRLFRILVRHYLRNHYLPSILASRKLTPAKRSDHLKVMRYLQAVIAARHEPNAKVLGS